LRVPVVSPVNGLPADRLQNLPSALLRNALLPYLNDRDLNVFHTVSRGNFHLIQAFLQDKPWLHAYHLCRLANYYKSQGWTVHFKINMSSELEWFNCLAAFRIEKPISTQHASMAC
jgi:hypothetical protein